MRTTFFGLETARRGMMTQQSALHTTGHNISNANTPGYTRQRVNFTQTEPYPPASKNRPHIPGQMGTGVDAGSIQRVRDAYIDVQYRNENNKFGYWNTKAEALQRMEEILNEPSEDGLAKTMDRFWQSLQDLAHDPTDSGARSVVRQRGIAVADTFNYLHNSLTAIQGDLKNEIDVTVKALNSLARQLNHINEQIAEVEPHGYLRAIVFWIKCQSSRILKSLIHQAAVIRSTSPKEKQQSLLWRKTEPNIRLLTGKIYSIRKSLSPMMRHTCRN